MEISNNRIKVTSMKTFAKFFLHFSLVILSCLDGRLHLRSGNNRRHSRNTGEPAGQ